MGLVAIIEGLSRYPIKGFSPEALRTVRLWAGQGFEGDRLFALENGPSGFDPKAPSHISKMRFAVLAPIAEVARFSLTRAAGETEFQVTAPNAPPLRVDLATEAGAKAFATYIQHGLGGLCQGPLRLVQAPPHRFFDDPRGELSLINLATLIDLGQRIGREIDPVRLRGNLLVSGWPPGYELGLAPGTKIALGPVAAEIIGPIRRCVATHVNPTTAERDLDLVGALQSEFGHANCGVYVKILHDGALTVGDAVKVE